MRRNAKNGLEKSGKALETAKTMGYTKIITEGKKMGIHMKKYIKQVVGLIQKRVKNGASLSLMH